MTSDELIRTSKPSSLRWWYLYRMGHIDKDLYEAGRKKR